MARFFSRMQRRSFQRDGGGKTPGGVATLLLETSGARSGETRSAMLGFLEDGDLKKIDLALEQTADGLFTLPQS